MEAEYSPRPEAGKFVGEQHPSAPPPAYSEIEGCSGPPCEEAGPPGYDVVMRQQSQEDTANLQGAVLRKKSLTNHAV